MNNTIYSIQYLRGVAALLVVFHHASGYLSKYSEGLVKLDVEIGGSGVDLFFIISGFVIFFIADKSNKTISHFLKDRIIRVVPMYWVYTCIMVILVILIPEMIYNTTTFEALHVFKSLFFIPSYHPGLKNQIWPILAQGWTLIYEMFFYCIFSMILFITSKPLTRLILLLVMLTSFVILGKLFQSTNPFFVTYTSTLLFEFFGGAIIGYLFIKNKLPHTFFSILIIALGVFGFLSSYFHFGWGESRVREWGIPSGLIVFGLVSLEKRHKVPISNTFILLGNSSYSLYLSHLLTLDIFGLLWVQVNIDTAYFHLMMFFLSITLSIVVGILSYRLVEKPLTMFIKNKKL